jgi:uncharacterized protein YprB with RNaseH-like and TPR domain
MLKHTFIHVPGVGKVTERRLWTRGIHNWEDCLREAGRLALSPRLQRCIHSHLEISCQALSQGDAAFFETWLPTSELWRMYPEFFQKAVFLDIETTGLSPHWSDITIVGIYNGQDTEVFVKGKNLEDFPEEIRNYSLLVTYNGRQFDVPFLRARFPGLELPPAHIDLRFLPRRLGLFGGLKNVERMLGLQREGNLGDVDGYMATRLWQEYKKGNQAALDTLIRYNLEDVVNLKDIIELAYNMAIEGLPIIVKPLRWGPRPRLDLPYDSELISWLRRSF